MIRSTFSGLSTAYSALQANQKRLDIVGQNLANMNTTGYTRQQLDTTSINYSNTPSFYNNGVYTQVGFGTKMTGISQIRDPYLDVQYRNQIAKSSYNDSIQTSLDSLAQIFDESEIDGINQSLNDIQSVLTNMQDQSKFNNSAYQTELRLRVQNFTNLVNDASSRLTTAETSEFQRLDGTGTTEDGAVQAINDILKQIGDLNVKIKNNQINGNASLELTDERNVLLDELASYVPIKVRYENEGIHEDWPDDLYVDMVYKDENGESSTLTLVSGSENGQGNNYGFLQIADGSADDPCSAAIKFTAATGETFTAKAGNSAFSSGSVQASLDMLGKTQDVKGYSYYREQLDLLAKTFADVMNNCNYTNNPLAGATEESSRLIDYDPDNVSKTIGISTGWTGGTVTVSTGKENTTDTILDMLASMSKTYDELDGNSFANFMNHVSTELATQSKHNNAALETNVTVLNSIQDSRDSVSAVSLDEEATNMMAYMSAYSAASRLMNVMDEALEILINSTGLVGR